LDGMMKTALMKGIHISSKRNPAIHVEFN